MYLHAYMHLSRYYVVHPSSLSLDFLFFSSSFPVYNTSINLWLHNFITCYHMAPSVSPSPYRHVQHPGLLCRDESPRSPTMAPSLSPLHSQVPVFPLPSVYRYCTVSGFRPYSYYIIISYHIIASMDQASKGRNGS
jgi:hypothetical protein